MRTLALLPPLFLLAPLSAQNPGGAKILPGPAGAPELRLDAARIAVRASGGSGELLPALAGAGLDPHRAEPWPIAGWWLAALPGVSPEEADARAAVAALTDPARGLFAAPVFAGAQGALAFPTSGLLVGIAPEARAEELLSGIGRLLERDRSGPLDLLRVETGARDGFAVLEAARTLSARAEVCFAEPDLVFTGRGCGAADDPLFADSWALHNRGQLGGSIDVDVDAPQAWSLTGGAPGIHVVLFDVGVQADHPDLSLAPGADFTGEGGSGAPVNTCDGHGTAVAGCIAGIADNGIGTVGVAPGCRVASARVFISLPACDGSWTTQTSWTLDALDWALSTGARVTCNSNVYAVTSPAVELKYAETRATGMVHVAAAGDLAGQGVGWPASLPDVLAVTPVTRSGGLVSGSSTGPEVALSAPGEGIWTTDRTGADGYAAGDHVSLGGSSLAAAYVAGAAALALSRNPMLDAAGVEQALLQGAVDLGAPGPDELFGAGLVNAWQTAVLAAPAGSTERVNVGGLGAEGNKDSYFPSLSADGRYVAFDSFASMLVPGDTNDSVDGFVHDRLTGTTERVTLGPGGVQGNAGAGDVDLSADGRFVAFDAKASNLVVGDTNDSQDAFVHDRLTGVTERLSVATGGIQADSHSLIPAISGDGRFAVFRSKATNLVAGDTNGADDAFVRDRLTGTTFRVSVGDAGQESNSHSIEPEISDDGTVASFISLATNLVPGDTNGLIDVFVRDLVAGTTELVSVSSAGVQSNAQSVNSALSADGRFVAFVSDGDNLVPSDTNGVRDAFVRDRLLGTTVRVSEGAGGEQGNGESVLAWISGDGRVVAFHSDANNLVPGDTNGLRDVFLKDLATGAIERLSLNSEGDQAAGGFTSGTQVALSRDGRFVAFESTVANLVADDANGRFDIFVRDRMTSGGWFGLGGSLPGTGGSPELSALKGLEALATTSFTLTGAAPGAPGAHVFGIHELYLPIFGGELVPSIEHLVPFAAAPDGTATLVLPWPALVPTGIDVRVQSWLIDPGAVQGVAASNAVGAQGP